MPAIRVNVWSESSCQEFGRALSAELDAVGLLSESAELTVAIIRSAEVELPKTPLLIVGLGDLLFPDCLAALRLRGDSAVEAAKAWIEQILDRPVLGEGKLNHPSPYWQRRLELAASDLTTAAGVVFPVVDQFGSAVALAIAVTPNEVIVPASAVSCRIRLSAGDLPLQAVSSVAGITRCAVAAQFANPIGRAENLPPFTAVAALTPSAVAPGWLLGNTHNASIKRAGAAIVTLDSGSLAAVQLDPAIIIPAAQIAQLVPLAPPRFEAPEEALEAALRPEDYADRNGYDENFLGTKVSLPKSKLEFKLLHYVNFTVAHQPDRKMALFTAVNLSGKRLTDQKRESDPWRLDPRLPADQQIGGKFYEKTPFDRGHMVRRLDPVWGTKSEQAETDTFHYPNSTPQHKDLNRKTWSDLEDYIYLNAGEEHLNVSVFTGPVLRSDDPYYHGVQIPEEFWKIAVIKDVETGKLSATGYIRSQQELIAGLEFTFGKFRTYQVPISMIEKKTGLDFGSLRSFDPYTNSGVKNSGIESAAEAVPIRGPEDVGLPFDFLRFRTDLDFALGTFDWKKVSVLVYKLVEICRKVSPLPITELDARRTLSALRGKRRFEDLVCLAEAFITAGITTAPIRRLYAQGLIDQGVYAAAAAVLTAILNDQKTNLSEQMEVKGLLGRICKQNYINAGAPSNPTNQESLNFAINCYYDVYKADPEYLWHGINSVALEMRARRDGASRGIVPAENVANAILSSLARREEEHELKGWDLGTAAEAHLALGQYSQACARLEQWVYTAPDFFSVNSCLRQLIEVWQLDERTFPGNRIVPLMRAHSLDASGGQVRLSPTELRLEKVFGNETSVTLKWYQTGLQCASSIARIEVDQKGFGTGWLVRASEFFPGQPQTKMLLVTNAHVMAPNTVNRYPNALSPEIAEVNFQVQGKRLSPGKVIFHSPVADLDCTIVEIPDMPPATVPLELASEELRMAEAPCRLFIIGYPGGRDVEFALHDNHLLAVKDHRIHYRTPTEGGSSGSPVFGPHGWRVVALHHAGRKEMPRIDGKPGTYEANEGISIQAIKSKIAAGPVI